MRIKKVELTDFKRFTHLIVEDIPETAKLIILVGPNGCGKTSFFEAMNHYYKYSGFKDIGDCSYLRKLYDINDFEYDKWFNVSTKLVNIDFYNVEFPKEFGASNIKGHFYFRSAYRNEPDFVINKMERQGDPVSFVRLQKLIQNDQTVSDNYQRLVADTISGVFNDDNNNKTVESLRSELTGKIAAAIERVFEDLRFSSLGEPLQNGSFYFTKGIVKDFHYRNLSAGEKSAFDLILDLVVQSKYYPDAIYCIDEPETHMHTKLQSKVLRELYNLIPGQSQLWLSTHSIGMLQEAEDIEKECPGTVIFLDFGERNFDEEQIIRPAKIEKALLDKFYELAFGDFAKLILPKKIVFCEGSSQGKSRKDFDKAIYTTIFSDNHPEAFFISAGSCNDIENIEQTYGEILTVLFEKTEIIKIVDHDDRSNREVEDLLKKGIRTLSKRLIESYLLDDEIIDKLCIMSKQPEKYSECLEKKREIMNNSELRKNPPDDMKSVKGEIYNSLKTILKLTRCGNTADTFLRDTMAPLITPNTEIYKQLEKDIFG